jgi:diguanylate cyclase (GGDEF)-like protein
MAYQDLLSFLQNVGKDPSRLIFEDELTGLYNRRFLLNYFKYKIPWEILQTHPVSLLMIDIDLFKQINDTHGHEVGDQTLIWLASLLREAAGNTGLPIRYAGDEFMILLPEVDKQVAMHVGNRLVELVHEKPVVLDVSEAQFSVTLSIGVACAPDDANTGKELIHKADTALYFAKKSGRDRLTDASLVTPSEVFDKTALYQLDKATIAGRQSQLATLAEALNRFSQGSSQFIILEGAAGMGKSEFLDTIRKNLSESENVPIKVSGAPQELFRPYYLITNILIEILNQQPDKGAAILQSLKPKEVYYLSHILPQLGESEDYSTDDKKMLREGLFTTLVHFIPKVVDSRGLMLLIDDLHFVDEATLLLLRRLSLSGDFPLFICAAAIDTHHDKREGEPAPIERFYSIYCKELDILKIALTPLTAAHIAEHLRGIFPQIQLPQLFEKNIAQVTQGNPLFVNEIVRKLVIDRKITLAGNQWVVEPLGEEYLPKSLEEIVSQKIAALDKESRLLLDQASTFGEQVSLSMLSGSSKELEAKVVEFVDQAAAQGLLSSEFQLNDETIRFLGKRVLDITYGNIEKERKQELHECVASYQETLFEQGLFPSAATLAYHFKRSANEEKAGVYERLQAASNTGLFDAAEAVHYTATLPAEAAPEKSSLDKKVLPIIPTVLRSMLLVVRNLKLYPPGSKAIVTANRQMKEVIDQVLATNEVLSFFGIKDVLIVNGQKIDVSEYKYFAESFLKLLGRFELKGITFRKGLTEQELRLLFEAFGRVKQDMIDEDFWQRFLAEQRILHIELTQVRYTVVTDPSSHAQTAQIVAGEDTAATVDIAAQLEDAEGGLDESDLRDIPEIMRTLLNAARSIKLYPLKSKAITAAIQQLLQSLERILNRKSALTLARVGDTLLVNGEKVDISEFETLAQAFLKFLDSLSLTSLTFISSISADELQTFIGALAQIPGTDLDTNYWNNLAQEHGLRSIFFDQRLYEARISAARLVPESRTVQVKSSVKSVKKVEHVESETTDTLDTLEEKLAVRISDLLLAGDETKIKNIFRRLLQQFLQGSLQTRQKVVNRFQGMLEGLNLGLQNQLAKLMSRPLLLIFSQEEDPIVLRELAKLLHQLTTIMLQFGEYPSATQILLHLHRRHGELVEAKSEQARILKKILLRPLESKAQQLILDDFRSGDPIRRQNAAQLLGSMRQATLALLISLIKNEEDLRVRQMAASLLAELGPQAAKLIKRELLLQTGPEERVRILEVIDTVTHDLRTELTYALADNHDGVRQAALQLAERLNDDHVGKLLLEQTENEDVQVAIAAIKCLGKLKPPAANQKLVSVMQSSKNDDLTVACCQSLGLIGDSLSIDHLAMLLTSKGFLRRRRQSAEVRATAALALSQIDHPRVATVLANYANDTDPRVRQIAQSFKLIPTISAEKKLAAAK